MNREIQIAKITWVKRTAGSDVVFGNRHNCYDSELALSWEVGFQVRRSLKFWVWTVQFTLRNDTQLLLCKAKTRKNVSLLTVENQAIDQTSNYCRIQIISTYREEKFGAIWRENPALLNSVVKKIQIQIWFHPTLYYCQCGDFLVIDKDQPGFIAKFIL